MPAAIPHFFVLGFVGFFHCAAVEAYLAFAAHSLLLENQCIHSGGAARDAVFHFERFVVALRDKKIIQLVGVDAHEL